MKMDTKWQSLIDLECKDELKNDPYVLEEYEQTKTDLEIRKDLALIQLASFELGLSLDALQSFQIWSCYSSNCGCSGWMSCVKDVKELSKHLETALRLYVP